ncbi:nicotinamidase-related amidase [Aquimarina sp. MAR_2010_214]|uniref:cysteine hydrolase family protein n=1 Tax=Aquimarina sp. MAR_2010_214 TaxID=1250026 RepID=UPI000C7077D5|nr:cysteine hydrolase family protein [Aquimarina sp. MAR_2010_214]PKV50395.1 nicotinamidase-related amidase [Aquimarina sp. MAR_2010_214]
MSILKDNNPALLLIDIQKGFENIAYWGGERNNPDAETNMEKLLAFWRAHHLPVFHIKHCSTTPASPLAKGNVGNDFMDFNTPLAHEPIIEKDVNSAFIGTNLKEQLEQKNIDTLVIIGLTTDHCVSTTTRMAGNFGFETYLIEDAVATFNKIGTNGQEYSAQLIHDTAIASLKDEFATIVATETLLNALS